MSESSDYFPDTGEKVEVLERRLDISRVRPSLLRSLTSNADSGGGKQGTK